MEFFPNYPAGAGVAPADWAQAMEAQGWDGICASDHLWVGATRYPHVFVAATAMACFLRRDSSSSKDCIVSTFSLRTNPRPISITKNRKGKKIDEKSDRNQEPSLFTQRLARSGFVQQIRVLSGVRGEKLYENL